MNEPKYTGRNFRQHLLLDSIRAGMRAAKFPLPDNPFEIDRVADEMVRRTAAGEPIEIADEAMKAHVRAELARRVYVKDAEGNPRLYSLTNRDFRALVADKSLSVEMGRAVSNGGSKPLIARLKTKTNRVDYDIKPPTNFSRKPPKRLETIEFHAVWDEDAPSN